MSYTKWKKKKETVCHERVVLATVVVVVSATVEAVVVVGSASVGVVCVCVVLSTPNHCQDHPWLWAHSVSQADHPLFPFRSTLETETSQDPFRNPTGFGDGPPEPSCASAWTKVLPKREHLKFVFSINAGR